MGLVDGIIKSWPGRPRPVYERYCYEPLEPRQVRVLHLHPGASTDLIQCSLVTHSLDAQPEYEALSYTWGDPNDRCGLLCDGKAIGATKNLAKALCRLRDPEQTRVVWADALCINQNDMAEREAQVLLMGDIYRAAQSVAVWLGSSTPNSQAAFRLLRQIHAAAQATAAADRDRLLTKAELARRGLPDDSGPDWKAVGLLFWRPWFTRVWIIQEVALARSSAVYCGGDSMPWHEFVGAADFIRLQYHALWVDLDLMPAVQLQQAAKLAHSGQPRDLLWLLSTFRDRFATNPADKIYGLLGLAPADHGVVPNYSAPVQQTYCEVARMLLQGQGSLDVLSLVGDSSWRRTPNLPSWVPDWATDLAADPYLFRSIAHVFHACGTATMSRAVVRFSPDGNTLTVRGALLDRVAAVGDRHLMSRRLSYDRFEESSILRHLCGKDTRRQFAAWERMVRSLGTYPTGEEIEDVLQRALVAGTDSAADPSRVGPQTTAPVPPRLYVAFRERHLALLEESKRDKAGHASTQASADLAARYNLSIKPAANGRRLFTTKRGYVGFGPMSTKSGDSVVLFRGGRTAYILREYRKKRKEQVISYALVGEAFVHGMMNGEGFADESTALSNFDLV